jgi:hypothetical protein
LVGRSRPRQSTIAAWYAPQFELAPADIKPELTQFLYWADRLLYAPAGVPRAAKVDIDSACRSAMSAGTRKLLATNFLERNTNNR